MYTYTNTTHMLRNEASGIAHTHAHIHTYICIRTTFGARSMKLLPGVHIHACMHACVHTVTHTHIHAQGYIHGVDWEFTHTHTHTHIYIYIYSDTYIYTCSMVHL
jgi:hypothetical protein